MQLIDEKWLSERGLLHDARVTSVRLDELGNIEIQIDDEWANARGVTRPESEERPLTLRFVRAIVLDGNLDDAVGGWISELVLDEDGRYSFAFTNRDLLIIQSAAVQID